MLDLHQKRGVGVGVVRVPEESMLLKASAPAPHLPPHPPTPPVTVVVSEQRRPLGVHPCRSASLDTHFCHLVPTLQNYTGTSPTGLVIEANGEREPALQWGAQPHAQARDALSCGGASYMHAESRHSRAHGAAFSTCVPRL